MNRLTDLQLLHEYTERRSEAAFTELVRRHVDLVYSAALRMVCDAHLADDVTQGAFVALAQNARLLTDHPVLSGWLHRTTQNLAAKAVRSDVRRRVREQEAAAMNELLSTEPDAVWEHIAPHLDTALGELSEADRDALLLRYFERKSASEMATILGISDDAAQKRVSRAVERLREFFAKRGLTFGASGLVAVITANAVQAAPVGLAITISATATLAGTTIAAAKAIAMTTLQKTVITSALAIAIGAGVYEVSQISKRRSQNELVQEQRAMLAKQVQQLQRERDDATNRLSLLVDANERLKGGMSELLKLRSEVGRLRQSSLTSIPTQLSPSEQPVWTPQQLTNVGRATAMDALQTLLWAGNNRNLDEISNSIVPDATGPQPDDDTFREFPKNSHGLLPGYLSFKVMVLRCFRWSLRTEGSGVCQRRNRAW